MLVCACASEEAVRPPSVAALVANAPCRKLRREASPGPRSTAGPGAGAEVGGVSSCMTVPCLLVCERRTTAGANAHARFDCKTRTRSLPAGQRDGNRKQLNEVSETGANA